MLKFKLAILNKPKSNGKYLIYLRITKHTKLKYISTSQECDAEDWIKSKGCLKNIKKLDNTNALIQKFKSDYESVYHNISIEKRSSISIDGFLNIFNKSVALESSINFETILKNKIETQMYLGKVGTANNLKYLKGSVEDFARNNNYKNLQITDIDYIFLKKYSEWLRAKGQIDGSIGVLMRGLRAIFNECIKTDIVSKELYPFDKFKVSQFKSQKNPRPITKSDIQAIEDLDIESVKLNFDGVSKTQRFSKEFLELAKDVFLFSYYSGGINFADIIELKQTNIVNGRLQYSRKKTKSMFDFKLHPKASIIVDKYNSIPKTTNYIFPILLKNDLTPIQIFNRKHKILSRVNICLKHIGFLCNIQTDITTYTARHTMASNLKRAGVSMEVISEVMQHSSVKVTQHYTSRLEDNIISDAINVL